MRTPGRVLVLSLVVMMSALFALTGPAASATTGTETPLLSQIREHRLGTWRWQRLMRAPLTPSRQLAERTASDSFRRWVLRYWTEEERAAQWRATHPRRMAAWLCIHRHEGPWTAHTGNGYYGGLQMDLQFQRTYGADLMRRKGTANHWTSLEQIWVAERAYRSGRGFYPWPNTARSCGLI